MSLTQVLFGYVVGCSMLISACAKPLKLRDGQDSIRELLGKAPVVVIGTVERTDWLRTEIQYPTKATTTARLRRISVRLETVLRGDVAEPSIAVYRYDCAKNCLGVAGAEPLNAGSRHAFLLLEHEGRYRPMLDLITSSIPISSGMHKGEAGTVEELVAKFLLTPGKGFDPDRLAQGFPTARYYSQELIGQYRTIERIKPFVESSSSSLRYAACLEAAALRFDSRGCLKRVLVEEIFSSDQKRRAGLRLQALQTSQGQLRRSFLREPWGWLSSTVGSRERDRVIDLLQLLIQHPDIDVKGKACELAKLEYEIRLPTCP